MRNAHKTMVGIPEEKRSIERTRHWWDDKIRMDLREVGWEKCGLDSCCLGWRPVAGSSEHGNESSVSIKGGEFLD
jgi:hypothetical protein